MIKIIYAKSFNNVIGIKNSLPWHIQKDLEIFKQKTTGQAVIMGRKTFESLPDKFRPLPNRINYIITTDANFNYNGINIVSDPHTFFKYFKQNNGNTDIWVIGGSQIYELAMQYADEIHVTEIMKEYQGDSFAPTIDSSQFILTNSSEVLTDPSTRIDFYISVYKRKSPVQSF